MKRILVCTCLLLSGVSLMAQKKAAPMNAAPKETPKDSVKDRLVLISTEFGDMKVKLYNATPKHRDNFIKLVEKGFYDSLLFHRVIKDFMIQGGDPDSKNAAPGVALGMGDIGYTIPAEFVDSLYHKKGALCAARRETPEKESSGCQFYIVQGKTATDAELEQIEQNVNNSIRPQSLFQQIIARDENRDLKSRFMALQQGSKQDSLNTLIQQEVMPLIYAELRLFKYTIKQRETYKNTGGTPFLDQNYTVFGEVVEGLDVIDKIAAAQTTGDRPLKDVRMKMKVLQ